MSDEQDTRPDETVGRSPRRGRAPIPVRDRSQPLPLSADQERLFFLSQLDPRSPAYVVPLLMTVHGRLDLDALAQAWRLLHERHEPLRTCFRLRGSEPEQVVLPDLSTPVHLVEAPDLDQAEALARDEVRRPVDLEHAGPARLSVVRVDDTAAVLALAVHHIVCDDRSLAVLVDDLSDCYRAVVEGRVWEVAPLALQLADYAAWKREAVAGPRADQLARRWVERLQGVEPLGLPTDRPRPRQRGWSGERMSFEVPADLAEEVRALARATGCTVFATLLGAFHVLVSRWSGQTAFAVGSALDRRNRSELRTMVGFFLGTLVLRAPLADDPTFREVLARTRADLLAALDQQDVPMDRLVNEVDPGRDLSRTPVFQVMFDLMDRSELVLDLGDAEVRQLPAAGGTAKFDLTVQVGETGRGAMEADVEYASELFDAATVERLARSYVRLLRAAVDDPDERVSRLDLLDPAERHFLLHRWDAPRSAEAWRSTPALVTAQVREHPDAPAVVSVDGVLSYAELGRRAAALARTLREHGVGRESVVAVCLDRCADLVPALLGVWWAGAAYVPIDPSHPADRVRYLLEDSTAAVLVTRACDAPSLAGLALPVVLTDAATDDASGAEWDEPADPGPDDLAYLIYTSGTTGRPKGVMVAHRGLSGYLGWARTTYAGDSPYGTALFASVAFDLVVPNLYVALTTGRPVHLVPAGTEPDELAAALCRSAPYSFVKLTPSHLELLASQLDPEQAAALTDTVVPAGDAFSTGLLQKWRSLSGSTVINEYGPTEITVGNSAYTVGPELTTELVPLGSPIPGTTMYVLDAQLEPAPVGVVGEVYVGGDGVARGYRGRPGLTADRFVPDPWAAVPGRRMYRTGDLARTLPDGELDFVGRADHQVKVRGYRVEPAEVEAVLVEHPGVHEAYVLADDGRLCGYLVGPSPVDVAAVSTFLRSRVPEYLVPQVLVELPALPLTANGKVDRAALLALDASRREGAEHVAPRSDLEARIATVWAEALGREQVGVLDNFFDLGGDSIRAVRVVGALRDSGLDVSVRDVLQERSVAGLAELLGGRRAPVEVTELVVPFALLDDADRALLPADATDAYPLTEVQAGMVFEMLSHPDAPYHNGTSYRVSDGKPFDRGLLETAANLVVARHELLRTSIALSGYSVPLQVVHAQAPMTVGAQDLRGLDPEAQTARIHSFMAQERQDLFDFELPPLIRLHAHVTSDEDWWISITECHPVIEGWGYHQMLMEVLTGYGALLRGEEPEFLPTPELRFADFVSAQLESLASADDRAYWGDVVTRCEPVMVPTSWGGGEREVQPVYDREISFLDLRASLLDLASRARVPLKSVLLAAHLKVVSSLTPEPLLSSGLVCDTRPEALGAERVIGMYLNTVPFEHRRGAATWLELVQQTFASEVRMWPHRRFPMPAMQRELAGDRDKRLHHLLFNYLDFHSVDRGLVNIETGIDYSPNDFDLVVVAHRSGTLRISAKPETVSKPYGDLLARMYRTVLEAMASDPDGDARDSCLPEGEWERVVRAANRTDVAWPECQVHTLFEDQVRRRPDASAVVATDGSVTTYAELNRRSNQLAWHLRARGVGPEDLVAVCLEHGVDVFVGLLGVLKAGAAYVPLDASHPLERLSFILDDTGARVVLTSEELLAQLPLDGLDVITFEADAVALARAREDDPDLVTGPDHLVYAMYTSGSTGRPKGVMISHRNLVNYLLWAVDGYGLAGEHGAPMLGSIAFDLSVPNFFLPLTGGKDVTLLEPDPSLGTLADLLRTPTDFSLLKITPAHLDVLRATLPDDAVISGVRTFVVGADEVKPETVVAWRRLAPTARIIDEYGPTETVVGCSVYVVPPDYDPRQPVPIGTPISNIRMYVLDADLAPVPTGVVGELFIGGVGVARGYLGRPGLTADRFRPDPYADEAGARCYRTGDLARRLPDGNLEFLGRIDNQVKIRGYRIELGEIEAHLLQHPGVRDACVAAQPDRRGDKQLVGYVVAEGPPPGSRELRAYLGGLLPAYMVPGRWVEMESLPLSSGGKVDRALLPAPGSGGAGDEQRRVAPRDAVERAVAAVWCDVLDLADVGVEDDFLDVGGHSLAALRVAGRLQDLHGSTASVAAVLQAKTVAAQALLVQGGSAGGSLVPLSLSGSGRPLVLVHPAGGTVLCYADLAEALARPVWGLSAAGLDGAVTPLDEVDELASAYLAEVRRELGDEVVLGGWSMGGVVAYAMARRLAEQTGRTPPVLLLDSYAPTGRRDVAPAPDDADFLAWLGQDWAQSTGRPGAPDASELAAAAPAERLGVLARALTGAGLLDSAVGPADLAPLVAVAAADVGAAARYRPTGRYPGTATLFAATDEPDPGGDPGHGWSQLLDAPVRVVEITGDHYSFLRAPELVEQLERVLGAEVLVPARRGGA